MWRGVLLLTLLALAAASGAAPPVAKPAPAPASAEAANAIVQTTSQSLNLTAGLVKNVTDAVKAAKDAEAAQLAALKEAALKNMSADLIKAIRQAKASTDPYRDIKHVTEAIATHIVNTVGFYSEGNQTISWAQAIRSCEEKRKRLCLSDEICPDGKGSVPSPGIQVGEQWVPVSDQNNEWVYVGNEMKKTCMRHTELLGHHPEWGHETVAKTFKGKYMCCDMEMTEMPTPGPSWKDAVQFCAKRNEKLCSLDDYCPDGKGMPPQGGVLGIAEWAAVFDRENEWVAIGENFPKELMCRTHSDIAKRPPLWGTTNEVSPTRGVVLCCPDKFINLRGKVTWQEANQMCIDDQQRLCHASEYCPEGEGSTPRGGLRPGEAWSPTGDARNAWVSTGTARPETLCKSYRKYDKGQDPVWGLTTGWQGFVQCCSGPPPKPPASGLVQPILGEGHAIGVVRNDGLDAAYDKIDRLKAEEAAAQKREIANSPLTKQERRLKELEKQRQKLVYKNSKAYRDQLKHGQEEKKKRHRERRRKAGRVAQENHAKKIQASIDAARRQASLDNAKLRDVQSGKKTPAQLQAARVQAAEIARDQKLMEDQGHMDDAHTKDMLQHKPVVFTRSPGKKDLNRLGATKYDQASAAVPPKPTPVV